MRKIRLKILIGVTFFVAVIEFSIMSIFKALNMEGNFPLLGALIDTLILSIIVFIGFKFLLIRHLEELSGVMEQVSKHEFGVRLKFKKNNPIGDIAGFFNKMAESLENLINELSAAKSNLTKAVDGKAKELILEKQRLEELNIELSKERAAVINMLEDMSEVNKNLKTAEAQLVQSAKMASIGQLAAGVAHEINNPLTGVLNNIQLIKMVMEQGDGASMSEAEFKELLDIIEESAIRCKNITQSLLNFSHVPKTYAQNVLINELIEKVSNLIGYELRLQNIIIKHEFAPQLPNITGNPQLLQQVFMNLITNSRWAIKKKSPDKGGTITIKTEYSSLKNRIEINVTDNGIGMSPEVLSRIFEPFFTTKDVGEGTGLGLSVIYGIIKEHKGTIEVESKPGEGTTFRVCLSVSDNKNKAGEQIQ